MSHSRVNYRCNQINRMTERRRNQCARILRWRPWIEIRLRMASLIGILIFKYNQCRLSVKV